LLLEIREYCTWIVVLTLAMVTGNSVVLLAELKVTNQFNEENMHVAQ